MITPAELEVVTKWLRGKIAEAEKALMARERMEEAWRSGADGIWKAVGCTLSKSQRLKESATHGRIAAKCRKEIENLKLLLEIIAP